MKNKIKKGKKVKNSFRVLNKAPPTTAKQQIGTKKKKKNTASSLPMLLINKLNKIHPLLTYQ